MAINHLHMRPEVLKRIREQYPVGCTVEIIEMRDPYRDMPAGLCGTARASWRCSTAAIPTRRLKPVRRR